MKNILLFLLTFVAFQTQAQFKYEELSTAQKQQVTAIEAAYNNALSGQNARSVSYNEFMLAPPHRRQDLKTAIGRYTKRFGSRKNNPNPEDSHIYRKIMKGKTNGIRRIQMSIEIKRYNNIRPRRGRTHPSTSNL